MFCPPLNAGGSGVHSRAQHDGKEADTRRVTAAATAQVGDRRERLDAMHRRALPYRCSEAARMISKDENPEKPYAITGCPSFFCVHRRARTTPA
jgi:hypothetical protein